MADYSVGNLLLDIKATEKDVSTTLSTTAKGLNSLYRAVDKFSKLNVNASLGKISTFFVTLNSTLNSVSVESVNNLSKISRSINTLQNSISRLNESNPVLSGRNIDVLFERISVSVDKIDTTKLERLSSLAKSFSSITNVNKRIEKIDFAKASAGFTQLATAIDPFIIKVKSAESALIALDNVLKKTNMKTVTKSLGGGVGDSKGLAKTLNLAGLAGKIYFIMNYTKRLAKTVVNMVQSSIDYTETLNLWQVAMRGNIDTAEEFISKMNKAYGIAEQTLMKYQATFRNMLSTLGGISADVSYGLSESLTQMALDYASLYNTSIEKAMTVFQSVLSGQVRPIRSISGYDITETTIFQLYQELGGTKTMRQLTQTEKRLLRIYAVFQQMDRSGAIGDLNKTLNNTANQLRIMSESAKELGVWIGKLVEIYIAPALPYLNAFFITAKNIVQAIVKGLPNYKEFDGTIKGYEETAEAMDEVQGKLLDFDKFRSLDQGQEADLGIDSKLLEGMARYESLLENVKNEAALLAEEWTALFIDAQTGEWTDRAKGLLEILQSIGKTILTIGTGILIFKGISGIVNTVIRLVRAFSALSAILITVKDAFALLFLSKGVGLSLSTTAIGVGGVSKAALGLSSVLKFLISPLGVVLTVLGLLYATNEDVRNSINQIFSILLNTLVQVITPLLPAIQQIVEIIVGVLPVIAQALVPIVNLISELLIAILPPLMSIIMPIIELVLPLAVDLIKEVVKLVTDLINILGFVVMPLLETFSSWIKFCVALIKGDFSEAFGHIQDVLAKLGEFLKNLGISIVNVFISIANTIIGIIESIVNFFISAINFIIKGINRISFEVPDWVPEIGGKTIGFNIKEITKVSWDIPLLDYAKGGMPDKGTVFRAGEAGAEMVYNTPSGQSGVANIQQIAQAQYQATTRALAEWWDSARNDVQFTGEVDGDVLFSSVEKQARRRGKAFGTV